jgi:hypothetical protein
VIKNLTKKYKNSFHKENFFVSKFFRLFLHWRISLSLYFFAQYFHRSSTDPEGIAPTRNYYTCQQHIKRSHLWEVFLFACSANAFANLKIIFVRLSAARSWSPAATKPHTTCKIYAQEMCCACTFRRQGILYNVFVYIQKRANAAPRRFFCSRRSTPQFFLERFCVATNCARNFYFCCVVSPQYLCLSCASFTNTCNFSAR